jgi:hypothetical protein
MILFASTGVEPRPSTGCQAEHSSDDSVQGHTYQYRHPSMPTHCIPQEQMIYGAVPGLSRIHTAKHICSQDFAPECPSHSQTESSRDVECFGSSYIHWRTLDRNHSLVSFVFCTVVAMEPVHQERLALSDSAMGVVRTILRQRPHTC